jgi:hypothetical protein
MFVAHQGQWRKPNSRREGGDVVSQCAERIHIQSCLQPQQQTMQIISDPDFGFKINE